MGSEFERARVREQLRAELFGARAKPSKLGRYEVRRLLGRGASSRVYVGHDASLDRSVALKLLDATAAGELAERRERLRREGVALARLAHPNVLQVYEIGVHDEQLFLAVELVDGRDLRAWLDEAQRDWRDVVRVMCDAGEGLAAAHALGLVHRDVKPANILVDACGQVRVADFGLVSALDRGGAVPDDGPVDLTRTRGAVGSPAYMSPEQWAGAGVDARSDQFGFCVTFHEALHGRRPFDGDDMEGLREAIAAGVIRAPEEDDVPGWLDDVIRRGFAADPADRYASLDALLTRVRANARSMELTADARRALDESGDDFARAAAAARVALERAEAEWADNPELGPLRDRLHERSFSRALSQGALSTARKHFEALGGRPDHAEMLEEAEQLAARKEQGLVHLEEYEREHDPHRDYRTKAVLMFSVGVFYGVLWTTLGVLGRMGVLVPSNLEVVVVNLSLCAWSAVAYVVRREVFTQSRLHFMLSGLGWTLQLMSVFVFASAWLIDVPVGDTFRLVQAALGPLWLSFAVYLDRRLLWVSGAAVGGLFAMHALRGYELDVYGLTTTVALGLTAAHWYVDARRRVMGAGR